MPILPVQIVRFVSDDPQPGIVECEFTDARGEVHRIVEKVAVVTDAELTSGSEYPQPGYVACTILERMDGGNGSRFARITIAEPWGVETSTGQTELVVDESELTSEVDESEVTSG
jgi:hypothetical protein